MGFAPTSLPFQTLLISYALFKLLILTWALLPAISAPLRIEVRGGNAPPLILSLSEIHRYAGVRQLSPYSHFARLLYFAVLSVPANRLLLNHAF